MKRSLALLTLLASLSLAACERGTPVVVEAVLTQQGGEGQVARPLTALPIRLLPYDRDVIFDSLTAAAATPEPQIPPEVLEEQARVREAEERWRAAEQRWGTVRDSMRVLSEALTRMQQQGQRATPQYNQAFQQFNRLDDEVSRLEQQSRGAHQQYTQLQDQAQARADSIRIARETWADDAFRGFDAAVEGRLRQLRREEVVDTTDAMGRIRVRVPEGRWWIYTRYTLPRSELYWNIPVEVRGDSVVLRLDRENAEVRPLL
jgi:hypothetical protein